MRTLKFIVDGQNIIKDPECNFDNIVPGSSGYLVAKFTFSSEWDDTVKVVAFWNNEKECPPQILKDGCSCVIPSEALINRRFYISIFGKKDNMKLTTNKVTVVQNGG